jgi:predicted RNA-binding protein with PIN domain
MKENQAMSLITNPNVAIETKTVIFGQDANSMSEQQLIDAIRRVEGDISKLKEVKTSSKKIASNIKELEAQLNAIVAVLDAR